MNTHTPAQHTPLREPHPIEGKWTPVRLEYAGESAPDMMLEKTEVVFAGGAYTVHFDGEPSFHGSYALTENTLHIEGSRAPHEEVMSIRGIYQLAGNRLRICLGMDGVAPEDFSSKPGSQNYLGTYRRIA